MQNFWGNKFFTGSDLIGCIILQVANNSKDMKAVLQSALDNGYRMFDTAYIYKNESYIGDALKEILDAGKFKREEIFVTSKVTNYLFEYPYNWLVAH